MDDEDFDDEDFCDICGEDISGGESHYHCANCGEVSSMMGHLDPPTGGFTCEARRDG